MYENVTFNFILLPSTSLEAYNWNLGPWLTIIFATKTQDDQSPDLISVVCNCLRQYRVPYMSMPMRIHRLIMRLAERGNPAHLCITSKFNNMRELHNLRVLQV